MSQSTPPNWPQKEQGQPNPFSDQGQSPFVRLCAIISTADANRRCAGDAVGSCRGNLRLGYRCRLFGFVLADLLSGAAGDYCAGSPRSGICGAIPRLWGREEAIFGVVMGDWERCRYSGRCWRP